uniref:Uncharacterized protein n=1 Tax=Haptolina brevifila TaxID=156173 RepID=A0A7S2IUE9_9EUKA|mmetsp:Transcript_71825/g.142388  ORF Transcript_71825/g.142388 Transcript_71825/m.142388 type:complete len:150 (+) Transcript_71825:145-594(+)
MAPLAPRLQPILAEVGHTLRALYERRAPPTEWAPLLREKLAEAELEVARAHSLIDKLPNEPLLVFELLCEPQMQCEAIVSGSARRLLQQRLKLAAQPSLEPDLREYILRACVARPYGAAQAVPTAQRMYVALQGEQFRLAIALSVDHEA